jgi:hypothetical protein
MLRCAANKMSYSSEDLYDQMQGCAEARDYRALYNLLEEADPRAIDCGHDRSYPELIFFNELPHIIENKFLTYLALEAGAEIDFGRYEQHIFLYNAAQDRTRVLFYNEDELHWDNLNDIYGENSGSHNDVIYSTDDMGEQLDDEKAVIAALEAQGWRVLTSARQLLLDYDFLAKHEGLLHALYRGGRVPAGTDAAIIQHVAQFLSN